MSKRPPGGPDSEGRGEMGGYRHAPHNADYGVDAGGSDEVCQCYDAADRPAKC